jgi:hypothetical protein
LIKKWKYWLNAFEGIYNRLYHIVGVIVPSGYLKMNGEHLNPLQIDFIKIGNMKIINITQSNDTINVFEMSVQTLFEYVNINTNYHVLKPWSHMQQAKRPIQFKNILQELAIMQQLNDIQESVIADCIQYVGLHKLLDFNIFTPTYKKALYALFTKFCTTKLERYKIQINSALQTSIIGNNLEKLSEDEKQQLIMYTELRCKHIQILNSLEIDRNEYQLITNNNQYLTFFLE